MLRILQFYQNKFIVSTHYYVRRDRICRNDNLLSDHFLDFFNLVATK